MSSASNRPALFRRHRHRGDHESREREFRSMTASAAMWPDASAFQVPSAGDFTDMARAEDPSPFRALLVNAHPDDESESAAVVYRITHELGGTVDQVIVTNGEGGHQYSAPAEAYYRLPLTNPADGRTLLGQIRREELMRASRILGIRHNYFLDQHDTGATLNPADGFDAWDVTRIRQELRNLLQFENYNLVLILLPTPDTHGHHKTIGAIALDAVHELEARDRPAIAGVRTVGASDADPGTFSALDGHPLTTTSSREPVFSFDRRTPLRCHPSLDYSIVVNWVIAEHKSQGLFQLENGRRTHEHFWLFEAGGEFGASRWSEFLELMEADSSSERENAALASNRVAPTE